MPVIATDWKYNKEVIRHLENGLLVSVNNPESICDAIIQLYRDRELAHQISINNLRASRAYEPKVVLKEFLKYWSPTPIFKESDKMKKILLYWFHS